jgi:fructosamine-3-kinase
MLNKDFLLHIESTINQQQYTAIKIFDFKQLHGGSVNFSYQLISSKGSYFIKINKQKEYPQMFEKELNGLNHLGRFFTVPEFICKGEFGGLSFLVLNFKETYQANNSFWKVFGEKLAHLHQQSAEYFGYKVDNYNGSLIQINSQKQTWSDFFIENRLMAQCQLARDNQSIDSKFVSQFEKIYPKIASLFPTEKPALLHGDLWSGNYLVGKNNTPILIDPAVYYGHREVDIAMSLLFGGFDKRLYTHYNEQFPLEKGWESRVDIANLYPLMVHVNLFGSSYAQRVNSVIKRFV